MLTAVSAVAQIGSDHQPYDPLAGSDANLEFNGSLSSLESVPPELRETSGLLPERIRILLLTANPLSTQRLAIEEEARAIAQKIRLSRDRDMFKLIACWAVQPSDLLQYLNEYRPHVVHFSGHGAPAGEIVLSAGDGTGQPVSAQALAELLRIMRDDIRVVLLNACYTATQAQAISKHVDFVIGTQAPTSDEAATVFAAAFYSALGFGRTVPQAFDQARAAVMVHGLSGHDIAQLLVRPGADPYLNRRDLRETEQPPPKGLHRPRRINQLPRDVRLVGRDGELDELRRSLKPVDYLQSATISPICGMPGVGKSALAIHFAHTLEEEYAFGAFYADFLQQAEGLQPPSPAQVLRRFMAEFIPHDEIPEGRDEVCGRWQSVIQGRRAIIVLDNVSSFEQIRPIIPHSRSCHVIVTSHMRLDDLQAHTLALDPLPIKHAVDLFDLIAEHTTARVGKDEQLQEVLEGCGGLPLAIRVLAARMSASPHLSLAFVQDALRDNTGLSRALGPGQESVVASFRVAYDALDDQAKRLFRRLGAVPGESFQQQLAAHIGEVGQSEAAMLLESLEQRQFVLRSRDERYFYLHNMVRRFAVEQLEKDEGDEHNSAQLRVLGAVLDHYQGKVSLMGQPADAGVLRLGTARRRPLNDSSHDIALAWVTDERFNLVAAVQQGGNRGYLEKAWRLAVALGDFFEIRSDWENWETTHQAVLDKLQDETQMFGRAKVLQGLGRMHRGLGAVDDSVRCYREALTIYRQYDHELELALTLLALGDVYRYARKWDPARNCLEHSHRILEGMHQKRALAIVKRSLAVLDRHKGDWKSAERYYADAAAMLEEVGDERWLAATKLSLADVYLDREQWDLAEPLLNECLEVFRRIDDRRWQSLTLRSLGEALRMQQRFEPARQCLTDSLQLLETTGEKIWQAHVIHSLGLVYLNEQRGSEALQQFDACLKLFQHNGDALWEARSYVSIALAKAVIHGDDTTTEVREWLARAWPIFIEQGAEEDLKKLNDRLD